MRSDVVFALPLYDHSNYFLYPVVEITPKSWRQFGIANFRLKKVALEKRT